MTPTERRVQRWFAFWAEKVWERGDDALNRLPSKRLTDALGEAWVNLAYGIARLPCTVLRLHQPILFGHPDPYCAWCHKHMPMAAGNVLAQ